MKWLMTFVAGALLGALGLFLYLRQIGHEPGQPAVALVPTPAPLTVTPVVPPTLNAPSTLVSTDLSEADLPLRPSVAPTASDAPAPASDTPSKLLVPVDGVKYAQLSDNFDQPRGTERHHEALDIMAPAGTKVFAVADGKVAKLFNSKPGGLTVYEFDPSEKYAYYYAHLERYADGLKEGAPIKRGELIGYVGSTGNANPAAPHLHFAVVALTPEKQWWKGTPLNPYPMLAD
ncbi:MAG: M23 family metallopeptidase [Massilia sp.]